MKVVILAGGFGTRISEESQFKPKPMIELGGMPILWHIMKLYGHYGFNEFVICAGYKQHVIKEYFDPPQRLRALESDGGGHRLEYHDRREDQAGAELHWERAVYADLRRRCF